MTRKYTNNRMQEKPNDFGLKYGNQKKHNEKAKWINNMTKELEGIEEGPKAEIHIDLLKTTLKRIWNWKTSGHGGIHGFWFKKFIPIHDTLALEMNRCLQREHVLEWMNQRMTTLIQKIQKKRNCSKQLQNHNLSTDDEENINSTNKGKDFQLTYKPRIVPWGAERMPQRIQRHNRVTLHWSTHLKWEQDQTEKSSYGLD